MLLFTFSLHRTLHYWHEFSNAIAVMWSVHWPTVPSTEKIPFKLSVFPQRDSPIVKLGEIQIDSHSFRRKESHFNKESRSSFTITQTEYCCPFILEMRQCLRSLIEFGDCTAFNRKQICVSVIPNRKSVPWELIALLGLISILFVNRLVTLYEKWERSKKEFTLHSKKCFD